jgi:hypothetical protein
VKASDIQLVAANIKRVTGWDTVGAAKRCHFAHNGVGLAEQRILASWEVAILAHG